MHMWESKYVQCMIRMSECVPGQQTATRYQETGLVHN